MTLKNIDLGLHQRPVLHATRTA